MAESQETGAVVEVAPETKVVGKTKKQAATGNLIADIASMIEKLEKDKALKLADDLANEVEVNYFKLGGVLTVIRDNAWFEGHASFDIYVSEHFGFEERKARYLIKIYQALVSKMIPWEKVSVLGWTKLKDLADILTLENVDEWVAKALPLNVKELQALLKQAAAGEGASSEKTTDQIVVLKFKLKNDQAETVQSALSKAKGELGTEFDTVALESICGGYLGGSVSIPDQPTKTLEDLMTEIGWEPALKRFSELFPDVNLTVEQ